MSLFVLIAHSGHLDFSFSVLLSVVHDVAADLLNLSSPSAAQLPFSCSARSETCAYHVIILADAEKDFRHAYKVCNLLL